MFRMTSSSKFEGEVQTLRLLRDPFRMGLGHYRDFDGRLWDVHGVIGIGVPHPYIQAAPVEQMHPYFNDTSGNSYGGQYVSQVWNPYYVVVVDVENQPIKDYREVHNERTRADSAGNVPVSPETD